MTYNRNYNKILVSDWLSPAMIFAQIGQCYWTVRVMPELLDSTPHRARAARAQLHFHIFFTTHLRAKTIFFLKSFSFISLSKFVIDTINW